MKFIFLATKQNLEKKHIQFFSSTLFSQHPNKIIVYQLNQKITKIKQTTALTSTITHRAFLRRMASLLSE